MQKWSGMLLIIFGGLFSALGLVAAARDVLAVPANCFSPESFVTPDLIEAFTQVVQTLATAPPWLALTIVGIFMIYAGTRLANDQPIIPPSLTTSG